MKDKIEPSVEIRYPEHEKAIKEINLMEEEAKTLGLDFPKLGLDFLLVETEDISTEPEMTDEEKAEMAEVVEKLDKQVKTRLLEDAIEFYKLVKEEEENIETPIIIKPLKPKSIKIPRLTYRQIKAHCLENNITIEDFIERVALNEINRIITRIGDIDYRVFKSLTITKNTKKKSK